MRYGSLCSGIGGLDIAVETVWPHASPAWFCEADEHAASVLRRWWPNVPVLPDLKTQDWTQVEPVELVTAGYPCQPFSQAGRRLGTDDPRHLWPFVIDAVRVLRPRLVVLENVSGHLGLGFDAVLCDLAEAGFDAEWATVRASDVGACHRRERLFVVCHAQGERGPQQQGMGSAFGPAAEPRERLGVPVADSDDLGFQRGGVHGDGGRDLRTTVADSLRPRLEGTERQGLPTDGSRSAWGDYEPAIRRWEHCLSRPAPEPIDGQGRLSVAFVEWMQGFDVGWVDGLSRTASLRCLGNAVVPQQGAFALSQLLAHIESRVA